MQIHGHGPRSAALAALVASAALARPAAATDWPQLWGPTVSGAVDETGPAGAWSLRELWRRPIGSGYSAVTISADRGYTGESDATTDYAIAFDVKTGKLRWIFHTIPQPGEHGADTWPKGPTISGGAGPSAPGERPPAIRSTTIAPQSPPCATKRS